MKTQEDVGAKLRERLALYTTLATAVTSTAITELDDAGDATKQILDGNEVMPIVAVMDGTVQRKPLTGQGSFGEFRFDVLLYLVGVRDDAEIDEAALRTLMSNLEKQVCEFVDAEGGNTDAWNFIEYATEASTDQTKTLADILFAAKLIPLKVTSYQ